MTGVQSRPWQGVPLWLQATSMAICAWSAQARFEHGLVDWVFWSAVAGAVGNFAFAALGIVVRGRST